MPRLSFQDSEVHSATAQSDTLTIRFAAASVQLPDGRQGYLPALSMALQSATWQGALPDCMGRLHGGSLWTGNTRHTTLPLPFTATGVLRLELQFANGTRLSATAHAMDCPWPGEAAFSESLAC